MGNIFWRGKPGDELFRGKDGDDTIQGWTGDDRLYGGIGGDAIYGQEDYDKLYGEAGSDRLDGGTGTDILKGGADADVFVFRDAYGKDRILDFKATGLKHDFVDLSDLFEVADFADLRAHHMRKSGDDVVIDGGNGSVLILESVRLKDLDAEDFIIF